MTPVLPGFAGFVPDAFTRLYPKAEVKKLHWNLEPPYDGVLQLQPTEKIFKVIGGKFVAKMMEMFFFKGGRGSDNVSSHGAPMNDTGGYIYNVDTYNEMRPSSGDPKYLADSASAVLAGLQAGDPDAVWMMQGWLFLGTFE